MKKKIKSYSNQFRSGLEADISSYLKRKNITFTYEDEWVKYIVPAVTKKYLPDFKITTPKGKEFYVEAKGLWDYNDRCKHAYIKKQHPKLDIRFVFTDPNKKIRKGSKTTYADICEGRGRGLFKNLSWDYAKKNIPVEWLKE